MHIPTLCDWFSSSTSASDSNNLVFTRSYAERKQQSHQQIWKKWKRSDSADSDSIALMTLLMTPIFDFHQVISAFMTPLMIWTLTPSLVKTSLKGTPESVGLFI